MTRSMKFCAVVALGAVAGASAQSISQQCQSTLLGVAGSPDAACLNVQGLLPLLTAPANQSLIEPATNWLGGACAAEPCTNDQISALVTNITTGCSQDLDSVGLTGDSVPMVISIFQQAYPTARKILCLKDNTNNTFCATTLLTELQNIVGVPLTIDNIINQLPMALAGQADGLPKGIVCSDCVKEAYNILKQDQPALVSDDSVTNGLTQTCGASFIDGADPSQIVEGTGAAAPTGGANTNGAAAFSQSVLGVAASSLVALSAAFVVLA